MIFVLWPILAVLVGMWANKKGRSGGGYFFLSLLLSPLLGGIILLAVGDNKEQVEKNRITLGGDVKCFFCAELIKKEAKICRYCSKLSHPVYHGPRLEIREISAGSALNGTVAKVGDVVFEYNGSRVAGRSDSLAAEAAKALGKESKILLVRDAEEIEVTVAGGPIGVSLETKG